MKTLSFSFILALCLCLSASAYAHRLLSDNGTHTSAEAALIIEDSTLSQVVYHVVSEESNHLWLSFQMRAGDALYWQLGLPSIDGLEDYRPTVVLLGPGLPELQLPFDVPAELGGIVIDTRGLSTTPFSETFTGTKDWIVTERTTQLQQDGTYYLVAFEPSGRPGKFWLAIGKREAFGLADIISYPEVLAFVRAYHEVDDQPLPLVPRVILILSRVLRLVVSVWPSFPLA